MSKTFGSEPTAQDFNKRNEDNLDATKVDPVKEDGRSDNRGRRAPKSGSGVVEGSGAGAGGGGNEEDFDSDSAGGGGKAPLPGQPTERRRLSTDH